MPTGSEKRKLGSVTSSGYGQTTNPPPAKRAAVVSSTKSGSSSAAAPTVRLTNAQKLRNAKVAKDNANNQKTSAGVGKTKDSGGTKSSVKSSSSSSSSSLSGTTGKKRQAWDYKGRLEDMEEMTGMLKEHIANSDQTVSTLNEQIQRNQEQLKQMEELKKQLEGKCQVTQAEASEASAKIDELKKELSELETSKNGEIKKLKEAHEEAIESLEKRLKKVTQEAEEANEDLKSARSEIRALKNAISEMTAENSAKDARLTAVKSQLDESTESNKVKDAEIAALKAKVEELDKVVIEKDSRIREDEQLRRQLHNTIQELKGNIRVYCRVRPFLKKELVVKNESVDMESEEYKKKQCLVESFSFPDPDKRSLQIHTQNDDNFSGKMVGKTVSFKFDKVFTPDSDQHCVFDEIGQLVQSALDGYNVCIFAYGQTGSGKTYTMEGGEDCYTSDGGMKMSPSQGMIPRSVAKIFNVSESLKDKGWEYKFEASFLEIYNETIRDLLVPSNTASNKKYEIKKVPNGQADEVFVTNLTVVEVTNEGTVFELLQKAGKNRAVASTNCNERSSRSHSVFRIHVTGKNDLTGEKVNAMLNLVDLAGSERLAQSGSTGDRLKETQSINKSLSNLGTVIMALGENSGHVPYRNSKLTYLLQASLGGNSKTLMFVNVSPSSECHSETINSLRFATKVNQTEIGTAKKSSAGHS
eukprot:Nk52_evm20s212 gene=Nk52_evmTU20s212